MTSVLSALGSMDVSYFMRHVWQRRPCVLRAAFAPDFMPLLPQTLWQLAGREDVESRLITRWRGAWRLQHGPLELSQLPTQRQRDWTLLVQGLDLVNAEAHDLLGRFRFIADARLDDVMASYAVPGGGVGPHVDSYDVFLLQARGRRHWRISRQRDTRLIEGAPLRLLAHFTPTQEWVLNPGDMLYLPPGVAHDGVALDECITLSIGFRTPTWSQLAESWFDQVLQQLQRAAPYRDASTQPTRAPARLPEALTDRTLQVLQRARPTKKDAQKALLAHLTEPKAQVIFEPCARPLSLQAFTRQVRKVGLVADPCSRMLYASSYFALNGELITLPRVAIAPMQQLANQRCVSTLPASLDTRTIEFLFEAYCAGWLRLSDNAH